MKDFYTKVTNSPRWFYMVIVGAGILAVLITLAIGLQQSVWFDEAYSIRVAQSSWSQLIHLTAVDTHPPLYYIILKLWAGVFGWGEVSVRLLSTACYGGSIIFAGLLLRRLFSPKIALGALPFLLLAPLLIRYGFEIRAYALASLIGVAATYVMVRAAEKKGWSWWWFGYAVLVAAGMLSLYYLALLWIAHLLWLLGRTKHSLSDIVKAPWLWAYSLSVVLFMPWLGQFIQQTTNGALAPISQAMTLDNLVSIVTFNTLYRPLWQLDGVLSLVALFAIIVVFWLIIRARTLLKPTERSSLRLLVLYILVPIAVLTLVSLLKPMYVERYLSHVAIGGLMLVGVSAAIVWSRHHPSVLTKTLIVGLLAAMSLGVVQLSEVGNYNFQRLQKPEISRVADVLTRSDDVIVANDPYVMTELAYYVPQDRLRFFSEQASLAGGYAPWSESPLRLDPKNYDITGNFTYVYYDTPAVNVAERGYTAAAINEYGSLKIARYYR